VDGSKFVDLMRNCGVEPEDLGINPTHKLKLKKGERGPSKDLWRTLISPGL